MEFRVLGPIEIRTEEQTVLLDGKKPKTILAALLLENGRVVSDSRLRDVTWGPRQPATVDQQLYGYVSRLRKLVGPGASITRRKPGYSLSLHDSLLDSTEFGRLAGLGYRELRANRHESATRHLSAALALWRGPALEDVTDFLSQNELPHLEEARMAAVEGRIEADLALGRHQELIGELTNLVEAHPGRERLRAQLMTALFRSDRQADALTEYHRGRAFLSEELGVDPSSALNSVFQAILSGDPKISAPSASTHHIQVRSHADFVPRMLPPDIPDFVGREEQRSELKALLGAHTGKVAPIVVTGMGGIGKSTLAVSAAWSSHDRFPDGQLYMNLGGTEAPKDPHNVMGLFLQALGEPGHLAFSSMDERVQRYRSLLAGRRTLVLLDNASDERQVRPLLPSAAGSSVVITGRSGFNTLEGTHVVHAAPLRLDTSLSLLARVAGAGRVTAEPNAACGLAAMSGGLPLALRAIAGRLTAKPHWSLAKLEGRLLHGPHPPLDELCIANIDLRASVRASYSPLSPQAKTALRMLSLLPVPDIPVSLAARALEISRPEAEDALEELVDARLLQARKPTAEVWLRYRMHPVVRMFAVEQAEAQDSADAWRDVVGRTAGSWHRYTQKSGAEAPRGVPGPDPVRDHRLRRPVPDVPGLARPLREARSSGWDLAASAFARMVAVHPCLSEAYEAVLTLSPFS
ncbi:BTAD domain-containing putative transcriptional regulator [Streptomyces olivaceus]